MPRWGRVLVGAAVEPWRHPLLGFDTVFSKGANSGTGTNWLNALDWLTYDAWSVAAASSYILATLPTAAKADYLAFSQHDLHLHGGTVIAEHWDGAAWVVDARVVPGHSGAYMVTFPEQWSNLWRLTVTCAAACSLGVLALGESLELERGCFVGFAPFPFARRDRVMNLESDGGAFLGRSVIREGSGGTLALDWLTPGWVRDSFRPFVEHAREKGWFILWNRRRNPDEAAYAWTTAGIQIKNSHPRYMSTSIPFETSAP